MAETATKVDTYKPTAGEMKLIEALSNPENRDINVSELCLLIGISRAAYYKMFAKDEFVKFYNEFQFKLIKGNIGDIIKATVRFATESAGNHADRKMLLEMAGVYNEKVNMNMSGGTNNTNQDLTNLEPSDRRARIDELNRRRGTGTHTAS
jgi:hypothetical protein